MRSSARLDRASVTLTALAEAAAALLPLKAVPTSFPIGAEALSPERLTSLLSIAAPARVRSARRVGGSTGTTDRVLLELEWDVDDPRLPGRIFVKSTPLSAKNRTMVAALSLARNEIGFYRQIRPALSARAAPAAYAAESAIGARHLLLLEDITANGAEPRALCDEIGPDYARAMMASLAELHATFWESPRLGRDLRWVRPERGRPGFALLLRQFRQVRTKMLNSQHAPLSGPVRAMAEFVNANDWSLHAQWERGPQTLVHGDCHLGNTYLRDDGGVGMLDWQVVHRAPGLREVAYFLVTSVPTDIRRDHTDELLRLYLHELAARGVDSAPTIDAAWDALRFFAFDAWDSSAICVVWPGLQAPENVEASFARANAAIEDLDVMPMLRRAV